MTVEQLIEALLALPQSARSATILVRCDKLEELDVADVRYDGGVAIVECDFEPVDDEQTQEEDEDD